MTDRLPRDPTEHPGLVERMTRWLHGSQHAGEHHATVLGLDLVVLPGVFSPRYYPETEFYAAELGELMVPGRRFLDLGCGAGANAVLAALQGAEVVACDLNPQAVENTRRNAKRHGVSVEARMSDVFSGLGADEVFDLIYWNVPFTYGTLQNLHFIEQPRMGDRRARSPWEKTKSLIERPWISVFPWYAGGSQTPARLLRIALRTTNPSSSISRACPESSTKFGLKSWIGALTHTSSSSRRIIPEVEAKSAGLSGRLPRSASRRSLAAEVIDMPSDRRSNFRCWASESCICLLLRLVTDGIRERTA